MKTYRSSEEIAAELAKTYGECKLCGKEIPVPNPAKWQTRFCRRCLEKVMAA